MPITADLVRFSFIQASGVQLHVAEAGPSNGPLVFLLHGFPEFWYGWRNQIMPLAELGFHVIAPDQRGYNLREKPKRIRNFDLDCLAADVISLADHFGCEKFRVAGHDWGGAVGGWLTARHAQRVHRLVILNAPHPAVWVEAMRNNPAQRRKSSYVRLFQIPYLPEFLISLNRSKALSKGFRDAVRPAAFSPQDLQEYSKAWSQPGTLTAMLHYYRAILKKPLAPAVEYHASSPTLIIW